MISNGKTNNEIGDYLVERYGEFILYRPRYTGYSLLLWIAPLALMLGGLFVVMRVIKSKSN
jgi:cytochrome c-type biogenesis protein CcmH